MKWRNPLFVVGVVLVLLILAAVLFPRKEKEKISPKETPVVSQPIDDAFWLNLDRRRSDKYREQLKTAPQVLVVRDSHYTFHPKNGIGLHYGWLDGRMANLSIGFSELVGYAYGGEYTRTEFPDQWTHGQLTNKFDVIVTITNGPKEALQTEARKFLEQQFHLVWHRQTKETNVLLIQATNPELLESKATTDFAHSTSISEFVRELENYYSLPVIDETKATKRYDKALGQVPARWVNGRTTNLDANNNFLSSFGLKLVPTKRAQEWLIMERVK